MYKFQNVIARKMSGATGRIVSRLYVLVSVILQFTVGLGSKNEATVDFVIVGGGIGGCVLANRLSETYKVLVLEEGNKHPEGLLDIPATYMDVVMGTDYVKLYPSVPQENAGLSAKGVLNHIVGIVPGGGSSINGMIYNRGSPYDYDNWANITEDQTWSYANLLKYFKRIEDYKGSFELSDEHGSGGPLPISSANYNPGLNVFMEGGKYLGYETGIDPNGPQKIGFAKLEFSRKNGRRWDAYRGYIEPLLFTRPNLQFQTSSRVSRIRFKDNKAVGVTYINSDLKVMTAYARKEVILSAGSINSPAILMRSGIGPSDVLEENNISPLKVLNNLGKNLIDHIGLKLDVTFAKDTTDIHIPEKDLTPENLQLYEDTGDGPFSSCAGVHAQAFLVSSIRKSQGQNNWPDLQIVYFHSPAALNIFPDMTAEEDEGSTGGENSTDKVTVSIMPVLGRPQSSGRVTLNPKDVDGIPLIDFRYFENRDDLLALTEAVKFSLNLVEHTPAFQSLGARFSTTPFSHCKQWPFRSEEYWECLVRYTTFSGLHISGTCRMGKVSDPAAVVDSNLKVIGTQGLRVVDASVMPNITNCNTQAAVYVIAEKVSDQILSEWQQKEMCNENSNDI